MSRVKHDAWYSPTSRLAVQERLDRSLAYPVVAEGGTGIVLDNWDMVHWPVYPQRSAVHEQRLRRAEGVKQLGRRLRREANQVHHYVGVQVRDSGAEGPCRLLNDSIDDDALYTLPLGGGPVRRPGAAAQRDYLMPCSNQAWHEVTANVPGSTHYDYTAHVILILSRAGFSGGPQLMPRL